MALFHPGKGGGEGIAYGRKGKGSLIHSLTDAAGMRLSTGATSANGDERAQVLLLLDTLYIRTDKWGRPCKRFKRLAAEQRDELSTAEQLCNPLHQRCLLFYRNFDGPLEPIPSKNGTVRSHLYEWSERVRDEACRVDELHRIGTDTEDAVATLLHAVTHLVEPDLLQVGYCRRALLFSFPSCYQGGGVMGPNRGTCKDVGASGW